MTKKLIVVYKSSFYFQYTKDIFDKCVGNGYSPDKIVCGMNSSIYNFENALQQIKLIKDDYPNFGGVYVWEYFNCPPDPKNPYRWSELINQQLINPKI